MNEKIVTIADLSDFSNTQLKDVCIKASVSIKSIRHGDRRHAYFYMDLRDDSAEITAVAYVNNENRFNQLYILEENNTYIIGNFNLEDSNTTYTSIPHWKEIVLSNNSFVRLCGNASKMEEWPPTPLIEVYRQEITDLFDCGIIGLCTAVTDTEIFKGELMRQVTLVDETRNEVILHVWSQETSLFDELDLNFHPVFFVKDARIFKYRGRARLSTSRYLRLLDPDDPRAAKIREALLQGNPSTNHPELNPERAVATIAPQQRDGYPYCTPSNYTRKNRNYVKIADLSDDRISELNDVTLIASVTMTSLHSVSVDLRDDSGEIMALVDCHARATLPHYIEKNKTYSITGFSLEFNCYCTSIPHTKVLVLNEDSEVKLCGVAPKLEWPLSPLTEVYGKDKSDYYAHAFGLCTSVTGIESDEFSQKTRYVTLVDQLSRELVLEVKEAGTEIFDALDLNTRPVFFVKDATMSDDKYNGKTVLETRLYIELLEPDDPRARRVTEALFPQTTS